MDFKNKDLIGFLKRGMTLNKKIDDYKRSSRCNDEMLAAFIDNSLSEAERKRAVKHINECDYCLHELVEMNEMAMEKRAIPIDVLNEYKRRIQGRKVDNRGFESNINNIFSIFKRPVFRYSVSGVFLSIILFIGFYFFINQSRQLFTNAGVINCIENEGDSFVSEEIGVSKSITSILKKVDNPYIAAGYYLQYLKFKDIDFPVKGILFGKLQKLENNITIEPDKFRRVIENVGSPELIKHIIDFEETLLKDNNKDFKKYCAGRILWELNYLAINKKGLKRISKKTGEVSSNNIMYLNEAAQLILKEISSGKSDDEIYKNINELIKKVKNKYKI